MSWRKSKPNKRRWAIVRAGVLRQARGVCSMCGYLGADEVHHIVRIADGGAEFDVDNLAAVCRSCHINHHRGESIRGRIAKVEKRRRELLREVFQGVEI